MQNNERPINVLFLCTGNSARSIMAEAILNAMAKGRFRAYSAGSQPSGTVRPEALAQIEAAGMSVEGLRSKRWDEFGQPGSPTMDYIFTVCDSAAHEACPYWPGHPMTVHWGLSDPAAAKGTPREIVQAFQMIFAALQLRIESLLELPLATMSVSEVRDALQRIGKQ